jgi:UDP-N-acetylmuramoyl-tripeptide--D-alanyl-D-alanine ligase
MEPIRLSDVLRATGGELAGPMEGDPLIRAVSTDSREMPPGSLFVPLRGTRYDGHVFVEQAFVNGAAFSLVARDAGAGFPRLPANAIVVRDTRAALGDLARWHRSRFDVPVIAVTGSCGKTTVKEMLRRALGEDVVASPASYNNEVGVPLTLLQMDAGTRACVVEVGTNAPGEIAHLASIVRPTVAVLTNVEEAHLERLGSLRGVMREKRALLEALPEDGAAIVNADNYWCREAMEDLLCHVVTFGTWEDADVYGLEPRTTRGGLEFLLFGRLPIEVPAVGLHNVSNALAAVAVALWLGRNPLDVQAAIKRYEAPEMRMETERVAGVHLINDAYNANPASMDAALRELAQRDVAGRRVAVLGEMLELGDETERLHRSLGRKVANEGIDALWVVGPHADLVAESAVERGMSPERVRWHRTVAEAISDPAFEPGPGDVWLFKASRGLRLERLFELVRGRAGMLAPPTEMFAPGRRERPTG